MCRRALLAMGVDFIVKSRQCNESLRDSPRKHIFFAYRKDSDLEFALVG